MKNFRLIIILLLTILLASTVAFGTNIPLGPYFDDAYFDLSDSALILKVISHEKGGLEADVSAYDGLLKISGGSTSAIKVKLDATSAPTVNNDTSEGYVVGSRWVDITNDKEYICLNNSDGAAVWIETTQSGGGGAFTDLSDTPANYTGSSLKHVRVNVGETALEFVTLAGGGDMLKATYDINEDGNIDVAAGGTEKSSWTLYAIPYLSGTTAFGEIPIGTAEYCLTVNATATGYDYTELAFLANVVDDTTPELGGELDAGAHSIGFTLQQFTAVDGTTTIDWKLGNKFEFTFDDENQTFTFTAPSNPQNMMLWLIQDGTGSRTVTWPATCRWPGGTEGTLSTAGGSVDIVALAWNGTYYDCVINNAFAVP